MRILTFMFCVLLFIGLWLGMFIFHHKTKHVKFRIGIPVLCLIWGVVLTHLISPLTIDRSIEYKRVVYPSQSGVLERSMKILSSVEATDGIYGIEGNHDNFRTLFAAMEKYGITPLSNTGLTIRKGLYVCGVEDLWNRAPDIAKAAAGARQNDFVLLLAHNPDVTMIQDTNSADLILSGHTHGGQFTFLGIWAPALTLTHGISNYGQRFMSGWAKSKDGTDVYVIIQAVYLFEMKS